MTTDETRLFPLQSRFEEALLLAARLHARQKRKDKDLPYISHLLAVTALVFEDGGEEDEVIAALLHDAVEDQGGLRTLEEIRRRFGERVAAIVEGCSDAVIHPKPPWQERKQTYLEHLRTASAGVRRVSLRTSCTTPARSWPIWSRTARQSGRASTAANRARCGITAPCWRSFRRAMTAIC